MVLVRPTDGASFKVLHDHITHITVVPDLSNPRMKGTQEEIIPATTEALTARGLIVSE